MSESYGGRTEADHATLLEAINRGTAKADMQPEEGN